MQKIQQHLLIHFTFFYNPIVVIPFYHMRSTGYFSGCFCYGSVLLSISFLCFNICSFWHCPQLVPLEALLHYHVNSVWSGFMCHTTQGEKQTLSQLFYWHRCTIIELWNFLQQYPHWFSQRTWHHKLPSAGFSTGREGPVNKCDL